MGRCGEFTFKAPKKGLCDYSKYYTPDGVVNISDDGVNDLYVMAEITMNTHYNYVTDPLLKEDMMSAALCKMLEFINSGVFDPNRGRLSNILYTCSRNEQKNQLYRYNRDFPAEDAVMGINEAPQIQVTSTPITIEDKYFESLSRCNDECIRKIKSTLNAMGFVTSEEDDTWYSEVERWVTYIIHRKMRKGGL